MGVRRRSGAVSALEMGLEERSRDPVLHPCGELRMSLRVLRAPAQPLLDHRKTCSQMASVMGFG